MKKLLLILSFVIIANAEYNNGYNQYNDYNSNSNSDYNSRGYAQPGDDNYLNEQIDNSLYGDNNAYQGSRPGDDDWGERNFQHLMGN